MKYSWAVLFVGFLVLGGGRAVAKDTCTHAWGKGSFKSYKDIENELSVWLTNAKILRLSLCGSGNDHYFLATILEAAGKVRVIRVPAR
jgi:nicotinamidase-related amidase